MISSCPARVTVVSVVIKVPVIILNEIEQRMGTNQKRPLRKLKGATQAEILRSQQKDDDFVKSLREKLLGTLAIFGIRKLPNFFYSDIPFRLTYFVFTSGLGNQTLGEEYTGIIQADLAAEKVPSLTARVLGSILECFGEKGLLYVLKSMQQVVNDPKSELTPAAILLLNTILSRLIILLPTTILLHKGLFYIYGRYYNIAKRIVGIDYAKVYGRRPTDGISWGLRLLGLATLAQCVIKFWQSKQELDFDDKSMVVDEAHSQLTCHLCLSKTPTTATLCGHLFCWYCIADWLNKKPQCPVCREHMPPSRIVHLMNL